MERQIPTPIYKTNVLLFKDEDVIRSNGAVYTQNLMKLAKLRKTDQFRKAVSFDRDMSHIDVGNTLERVFPVLRKKRFFCATSTIGNNPRLNFDGERRVWDGATIKRNAKGNRCLYVVPDVEGPGFKPKGEEDLCVGKSESGYSSEEVSRTVASAELSNRGTALQEATIAPKVGPLKGRTAVVLRNLPRLDCEILIVAFRRTEVKAIKEPEGDGWLLTTPEWDKPEKVPVIIMKSDRNEVGQTEFTYTEDETDAVLMSLLNNKELKTSEFCDLMDKWVSEDQGSGGSTANHFTLFGPPKQGRQLQSVEILRRMLYIAARIGKVDFIQTVFNTSADRVVFGSYKNRSTLPEHIAEANGHDTIAAYLRQVTERFSTKEESTETQSSHVNWRELARTFEEREKECGPTEAKWRKPMEDDASETYFGDTEVSDSDKERSDCDSEFERIHRKGSTSVVGQLVSKRDQQQWREGDILRSVNTGRDETPSNYSEKETDNSENRPQKKSGQACTIEMGLDPSHQLSEGDIHDYELPDKIGDNWRDLARALGYIEAQIRSIEKEKRNSNKECCIEILVRWLHEKGKYATAGKLAEALAKIKLQSLAEKLVKPNDQSQFEKTLALWREDFEKKLALLREDGSKMRATIKELEEKDSKLQERIKDELEDASEQGQKDLENAVQLFDTQNASVVSMDTDLDQAARERLKNLTKRLNTYVTPQLEVREVNQDQLKMTVKLDLLRRLSENLQKIYSDVVAMASETCKCNEDVKRDFYDFAYHGLQAQHNELVHRVEDLKSAQHGMSEEEKKNLVQLQSYQANRQRQVEQLDKRWRGLFSPPEHLPKTPCSDTTGVSDKSKESKKVSRHTDPGARPKSRKVRAKGKAPADCDDDENEVRCNVTKRKSIFGKKEKDKHETCTPISYSSMRDS